MKRKSSRKASKKEEENSNDAENTDHNGETYDVEEETPKEKKKKSSKGGRKSVSFTKKDESDSLQEEVSEDIETEEELKEVTLKTFSKNSVDIFMLVYIFILVYILSNKKWRNFLFTKPKVLTEKRHPPLNHT